MKLALVALLLLSACAPEQAPRCVISPVAPMAEGDTPVIATWCKGEVPVLVVDPSWTCDAEVLGTALDFWRERRGESFEVERGPAPVRGGGEDLHVYLQLGNAFPGGLGNTWTTFDKDALVMKRASMVVAVCDPLVLAHELGHALGYDESPRPGSLMNTIPEDQDWEIRDSELAALEDAR